MKKGITQNLTFQVLVAVVLGILLGIVFPDIAKKTEFLGTLFIKMIKMIIAPIIFLTIVLGIGKVGDMKKFGRIGGKALGYFIVMTTFALIIGLVVGNLIEPGAGVNPEKLKVEDVSKFLNKSKEKTGFDHITSIVPENVVGAFASGDILQVLFFSILFGIGIAKLGGQGSQQLLHTFENISHVLFKIMGIVMRFAPLGAFGAMAAAIGKYGLEILIPLGKLMITMYTTMACFIFIILNLVCLKFGFSLWKLLVYIKEEIFIVLGTSSSESVLPRMIEKMEHYGCSKQVAGLVIPTGYSFNLDGTAIYLSMSVIFLAQVFQIQLSLQEQLTIVGILILTSKGAAGVAGSGFIVLASTLASFPKIPLEGLGILLAVDKFMSEARSITNLIGNAVATLIIAKHEGEFSEIKQSLAEKQLNTKE
ncbi:glutamate:protein symporter [bacterium 336/3]|nr:glutamate:protein symporter [bacterium 336/3]